MATLIALLRGINVGGNTLLPMAELREICSGLGFLNVRTYIQSGNIIFESNLREEKALKILENALQAKKEKHIAVIIRSPDELESIISNNPFPNAKPNQVGVLFLSSLVQNDFLKEITIKGDEEVTILGREVYIHYPNGMGRSKLKLPKMAELGTVRNINTVTRLAEMSQ